MLKRLKLELNTYTQGKTWYWYAIPWLFGLYVFVQLLQFSYFKPLPFVVSIPAALNFMLHEVSHVLFGFLPELFMVFAGSIAELLLGLMLIYGAFRSYSYFTSLFCFLWFMLSCQRVGEYIADARAQNIDLVSLGNGFSGSEGVIHDWNYILAKFDLLNQDILLANITKGIGIAAGVFGLVFGLYLIIRMATAPKTVPMSDEEANLLHSSAQNAGLHAAPPKHFKDVASGTLYPEAYKGSAAEKPVDKKAQQ